MEQKIIDAFRSGANITIWYYDVETFERALELVTSVGSVEHYIDHEDGRTLIIGGKPNGTVRANASIRL